MPTNSRGENGGMQTAMFMLGCGAFLAFSLVSVVCACFALFVSSAVWSALLWFVCGVSLVIVLGLVGLKVFANAW